MKANCSFEIFKREFNFDFWFDYRNNNNLEPIEKENVSATTKQYEATVVIICIKEGKVFLSKRSELCATYKGYFCVAGGKLERHPETNELENPLDGAIRELHEETGLLLEPSRFEFHSISTSEPTSKVEYIYKVWLRPGDIPKNMEPHKHTSWIAYPIEDALKLNLIPKLKPLFEEMLSEQKI